MITVTISGYLNKNLGVKICTVCGIPRALISRVVLLSLVFLSRHRLILKMETMVSPMLPAGEEAGLRHIPRKGKHTEIRLSVQQRQERLGKHLTRKQV